MSEDKTLGESVVWVLSSCPSLDFLQTSKLLCALNLTKWLSSTRCENVIKIIMNAKQQIKNAMVMNNNARMIAMMIDGIFGFFICEYKK